jgi:hypothetical protein
MLSEIRVGVGLWGKEDVREYFVVHAWTVSAILTEA